MNDWRALKRRSLWFILPAIILLSLALTYLAASIALPPSGIRVANAQSSPIHIEEEARVILARGESQTVGRVKLTYQGLKTGYIVINISPAHAHTGYTYRRDIPIIAAEKGFWLAQQYYKLVSAERSKLEINRIHI